MVLEKILVLALISSIAAQGVKSTPKELPADKFEDLINTSTGVVSVVFFGAEWCGHCKHFKPSYTEIHKETFNSKDTRGETVRFFTHFA